MNNLGYRSHGVRHSRPGILAFGERKVATRRFKGRSTHACSLYALCALFLFTGLVAAQQTIRFKLWQDPEYLIETWETEDGLPENSATSMVQTPDGYLWFGTFNGLVRFDGVRFVVFDHTNTPELPDASVVSIYLDSHDRMWVSTLQGLAVREGNRWRRLGEVDGWSEGVARTFAGREGGEILITTFDQRILEYSGGKFRELPAPLDEPQPSYGAADGTGQWWVGQDGFFGFWDGLGWIQPEDAPEVLNGVSCFGARDGGIWVVAGRELLKYHGHRKIAQIELPDLFGSLWGLYEDHQGHIWISTHDRGVFRIDPAGPVRQWQEGTGLSYNGVRFVFEDRERNLWIGTSGGGLTRFTARRVLAFGINHGLTEPVVNSVWTDKHGGVLVGTYGGGLFRMQNDIMTRVDLPPEARYIQSVVVDRNGSIWVGTFVEGLFVVDGSGWERIASDLTGGNNVIAQFIDSQDRMWVSGGQGVSVHERGSWRPLGTDVDLYGTCAFAEDQRGRIWAASRAGVFVEESGRFMEVRDSQGRSIRDVISLHADANGDIWMGSRNQGISRWRNGQLVWLKEKLRAGLRSVGVITDDGQGHWWLTTNLGLLRIAGEDLAAAADGVGGRTRLQLMGVGDGLATTSFTGARQPVAAMGEDGRLWFATTKGILSVTPSAFTENSVPPQVRIESVRGSRPGSLEQHGGEGGEEASPTKPQPAKTHVLPAGVRRVSIGYTALSFADPDKVRFEVMIDGLDAQWRDMGDRREAVFHDLSPGDFVFRVRAANNDGIWNEAGESIAFRIDHYPWQTDWFRIGLASVFLCGIGAGAWRFDSLRIQRRNRDTERFRLVVELSPNSIVVVDSQGLITLVNSQAEQDFGYSREEMIGSPLEMLVPERFRAGNMALRTAYQKGPGVRPLHTGRELHGLRKDGSEFPSEIGLTPIKTNEGVMVLASIMNISERKKSEAERLRQRNELAHLSRVSMLGELSGSLAHELNQPLTAILSNAQAAQRFLQRDHPDIGEIREILQDVVEESKHAGDVIHNLRLLLKKGEIDKAPLELGEVIRNVLRIMRSDLITHGVTVSTIIEPNLPRVLGAQSQLQQVLLNLVMNASESMSKSAPDDRRLRVTARQDTDGQVLVSVIDQGPGIPQEDRDLVFQTFYTTKDSGIGMGLAVCRTIVSAHGGRIWFVNPAEGGTAFHVCLPSVKEGE